METTVEQKKEFSFKDAEGHRIKIEAEITHRNGYSEFTMSGDTGHGSGQIYDCIKPKNLYQEELIHIWKTYHLNGMNAGTPAQNKILDKCEDRDYDKRVAFLFAHTIEGTPITKTEADRIDFDLKNLSEKVKATSDKLERFAAFREEYKNTPSGAWIKSEYPDILKVFKGDQKDFANWQGPRFYKERTTMQASQKARLDNAEKEVTAELKELITRLSEVQLSTALYDKHPETGEPYKYGSGWIKEHLPENFWEDFEKLVDSIEQEDSPNEESIRVVDIADPNVDDSIRNAIEEANDDENAQALAFYLELTTEDLEDISKADYGWGDSLYEAEGREYYIGTWDEIRNTTAEYIKESLWAFNASFLSEQTDLPKSVFTGLQSEYESSNDAILDLVNKCGDFDSLVDDAISIDGWEHFLNGYDGAGSQFSFNGTTYYVCRT